MPSNRTSNQLSTTSWVDPEVLHQKLVPKATPKLVAAPSTPPAGNSNAPLAVPSSSIPTTSLPTETAAPTVVVVMEDRRS